MGTEARIKARLDKLREKLGLPPGAPLPPGGGLYVEATHPGTVGSYLGYSAAAR